MELVCPAGNIEKLSYAYAYGADTAYIGLKRFSLRIKADNFYEDEYKRVIELKKKYPQKRLFCALNISFHNHDIEQFMKNLDYFKAYPIDAFIVQDIGMVPLLQREFPNAHLHLSTQASCVNSEAVKMYKSMGFKRVVLGRETSLDEIRQIKDAVPDVELECFGHGAMCIAYSGRCLMSAYLTGRSAQSGFCSQPCRWDYNVLMDPKRIGRTSPLNSEEAAAIAQSGALVLEEHQRPGEYFPVFEGENFTAVMSSKDLCMIDHLKDMKDAGVDAVKVEGRMKSVYYVAMVARAYRKAIDALEGKIPMSEAEPFMKSLDEVAHRECTTGFYYNRGDADKTTIGASDSSHILAGQLFDKYSAEDTDKIFEAGNNLVKSHNDSLEAMHPGARAAAERDYAAHPEKVPQSPVKKDGWKLYKYNSLNKTDYGTELEVVTPDELAIKISASDYQFINPETGEKLAWVNPDHNCALYTKYDFADTSLVRVKDPDYKSGIVRDTGR